MPRGGLRPRAGRKPWTEEQKAAARARAVARSKPSQPVATPPAADPKGMMAWSSSPDAFLQILQMSEERSRKKPRTQDWNPYIIRPDRFGPVARHIATHARGLAMDSNNSLVASNQYAMQAWQAGGLLGNAVSEGLLFMGYPYLSELAQRPEFRLFGEIRAEEMTRKWIEFRGTDDESTQDSKKPKERNKDDDERSDEPPRKDSRNKEIETKIKELKEFAEHLKLRDWFKTAAAQDSFFGISHLMLEMRDSDDDPMSPELKHSIGNGRDKTSDAKLDKNCLRSLRVIEPIWVYPTTYNATNPLAASWYDPQVWYVMGTEVHASRLMTFIGRPVPDILKPAYAFGGLSMTQMAQPYVDIWLKIRESVGEIVHAFSVMVLSTNLATTTMPGGSGGGAGDVLSRMLMFNTFRDNQGLIAIDKATEDFKNISAPLSGLDQLQAQAQEHMFSVGRIPAVKFAGIQPQGLNATSEGEMRAFNDTIHGNQEHLFRSNLTSIVDIMQISLWGARDPDITFEFNPLEELTDKEKADIRKTDAETDQIRIDSGIVSQEEVRTKLVNDPESDYHGLDPDDVPDLLEEEEQGLEPMGGRPQPQAEVGEKDQGVTPPKQQGAGGEDAAIVPFPERSTGFSGDEGEWEEGKHPRAPDGKFGKGGGGGKTKQKFMMPQFGLTGPPPQGGSSWGGGAAANSPAAPKPKPPLNPEKLKRVGEQMGSNPGGVFEDEGGERFYVKKGKSKEHVREELLAAKLYDLAGARTLDYRPVEGGGHIATKMQKLDKDNANKLSEPEQERARKDFVTHAWLANWDATGLGGDNIGVVNGKPTSLDLGGALSYRAQGAPKGGAFGTKVGELDTLRDPKMNKDSAKLFGKMTPAELRESARRVTSISDKEIQGAVDEMGAPSSLAEKLIARRDDIAARARTFGAEGDPAKPTSTVVFAAGDKPPVKALNGIPFKPWTPPEDWNAVEGQATIDEPEPPTLPLGKTLSSGLLIRESDGRVWLARPKGGAEEGLSLQANAIKEAWEETGLKGRVTGFAGDHEGDSTVTRFYIAEREAGDPSAPGWESDGVVLAPPDKLGGFLNRSRDQTVAKQLAGDEAPFEEGKHPRDSDGKFSSTGGGSGGEGGGEGEVPKFKSKKEHAAHLLEKGVTTQEMLNALKWPSISMPAMAKSLNMKLEKVKEGGVTKYKGTPMTKEELAAQQKPAIKPPPPPPKPAEPPPPPKPEFPAPTEAELQKAKKSVPLKLEYLGVPNAPDTPAVQGLIKLFNEKYAGKELTDPAALADKVNNFKLLKNAVAVLAGAESQKQIAAQAEAQAAAKVKAEAAMAAQQEKKKQLAAQHAEVAKSLGITDQGELEAFDAFIDHFGGVENALSQFKVWQSEAQSAAKKNPGHGFEKLSGFEMGCIKAYTGPQSGWINKAIIDDVVTPAQFMFEKTLNTALDKLPKKTGQVKRGLTLDAATQAKLVPGKIWTHRNFASSSSEGWQGNTKLHIEATGKGGSYVAPISSHKGEGETLFKSNLKLYIQKIEKQGGVLHVTCREM